MQNVVCALEFNTVYDGKTMRGAARCIYIHITLFVVVVVVVWKRKNKTRQAVCNECQTGFCDCIYALFSVQLLCVPDLNCKCVCILHFLYDFVHRTRDAMRIPNTLGAFIMRNAIAYRQK